MRSLARSLTTILTEPAGTRTGQECHKLLTDKAKSIIQAAIEGGVYDSRTGEKEPPFMAPSTDPDAYSMVRVIASIIDPHAYMAKWCSRCNDFGEFLVLCAGCRVGICLSSTDHPTGCLEWNPSVDNPDLVFHCPYCAKGRMEVSAPPILLDIHG